MIVHLTNFYDLDLVVLGGFTAATPNASDLVNINIVAGHITYQEDLGLITNAVNTGSGKNSEKQLLQI
ncbi:MAG: hypothetical protein CM15mL6_110 [uncultured marine virus]|nr:MAG: hypothetical protein CM15mL6_110 [uncultured marine virus]